MAHHTLPPELTDQVISFIGEDKKTQASCSLVCRAWLPRSRSYLFRTIELPNFSVSKFLDFILACKSKGDTSLISPARHVRSLCFTGQPPGTSLNVEILPRILHLLPRIDRISITKSSLIGCHEKLDAAGIRLKELTITETSVASGTPQAFLQLLSILTQVDILSISSLAWDIIPADLVDASHPDFPSHLEVSCLTLINYGLYLFFPGITTLMQRIRSIHTLSDVRLQCNNARDVAAVGAFLSHPDIVVQALSVDLAFGTRSIFNGNYDPAMWRQLNIPANQLLKELNFVAHLDLTMASRQYVADQFLSATNLITDCPDALESITFFCWVAPGFQQIMGCLHSMGAEFIWLRTTLLRKSCLRRVRWLWGTNMAHAQFASHRTALDAFVQSKLRGLQEGILELGIWGNEDTTLGEWLRRT